MRRLALIILALALITAACGGDDDAASEAPDAEPTAQEPADEPAEAPAEEPADEPAEAPAEEPADEPAEAPAEEPAEEPTEEPAEEPTGSTASVTLSEWVVDTSTTFAPGTVSFEVTNGGSFPHEFGVARGNSYEELPLLDNGAIDEDTLGDDFLGKTEIINAGQSATIDFDLEAGNYVLFCNISAGPNSHAANGQVLSVTVG